MIARVVGIMDEGVTFAMQAANMSGSPSSTKQDVIVDKKHCASMVRSQCAFDRELRARETQAYIDAARERKMNWKLEHEEVMQWNSQMRMEEAQRGNPRFH